MQTSDYLKDKCNDELRDRGLRLLRFVGGYFTEQRVRKAAQKAKGTNTIVAACRTTQALLDKIENHNAENLARQNYAAILANVPGKDPGGFTKTTPKQS